MSNNILILANNDFKTLDVYCNGLIKVLYKNNHWGKDNEGTNKWSILITFLWERRPSYKYNFGTKRTALRWV